MSKKKHRKSARSRSRSKELQSLDASTNKMEANELEVKAEESEKAESGGKKTGSRHKKSKSSSSKSKSGGGGGGSGKSSKELSNQVSSDTAQPSKHSKKTNESKTAKQEGEKTSESKRKRSKSGSPGSKTSRREHKSRKKEEETPASSEPSAVPEEPVVEAEAEKKPNPGKVSFQLKKKAPLNPSQSLTAPLTSAPVQTRIDTPPSEKRRSPAVAESEAMPRTARRSPGHSRPARSSRSPPGYKMSRSRSKTRSVTPASTSYRRRRSRSRSPLRRSRSRSRSPRSHHYASSSSYSKRPATRSQLEESHRGYRDRERDRVKERTRSPVHKRQHSPSPQEADHRRGSHQYSSSRTPQNASSSSSSYYAAKSSRKDEASSSTPAHDSKAYPPSSSRYSSGYGSGRYAGNKSFDSNESAEASAKMDEEAKQGEASGGGDHYQKGRYQSRTSSFSDYRPPATSYSNGNNGSTAIRSARPQSSYPAAQQTTYHGNQPYYSGNNSSGGNQAGHFNSGYHGHQYGQSGSKGYFPYQGSYNSYNSQSYQQQTGRFNSNSVYRYNSGQGYNSTLATGVRKPAYPNARGAFPKEELEDDLNDSIEELSAEEESDADDVVPEDDSERRHGLWRHYRDQGAEKPTETSDFSSYLRRLGRIDFSVLTKGGGSKDLVKTVSSDGAIKSPIRVNEDEDVGAVEYSSAISKNLYESYFLRRSNKFSQLVDLCEDLELDQSGLEDSIRFLIRLDFLRLLGAPIERQVGDEITEKRAQILSNLRSRLGDELAAFEEPCNSTDELQLEQSIANSLFKAADSSRDLKIRGIHLASDMASRGLLESTPLDLQPRTASEGCQLFEQCLSLFTEL